MDSSSTDSARSARAPRVSGLALFIGIVLVGVGAGAGYFRFAAPRAKAETEERLAGAPRTAEERIGVWLEYVEPAVRERLRDARISAQQPWIVTHTLRSEDGGDPEVWGIPSDSLGAGLMRCEGLEVIVHLVRPERLAQTVLVGDHARSVPEFAPSAPPEDPSELLRSIAEYALRHHREKLAKDIDGASLRIEIEEAPAAS